MEEWISENNNPLIIKRKRYENTEVQRDSNQMPGGPVKETVITLIGRSKASAIRIAVVHSISIEKVVWNKSYRFISILSMIGT